MPLTAEKPTSPAFAKAAKPAEVLAFPSGQKVTDENPTDRLRFEETANKYGFTGQQREQFIRQSMILAENQRKMEAAQIITVISAPIDMTWKPMQLQQQMGAQISMTDEERTAIHQRQIAAQKAQLIAIPK